jgi:integrase
VEPMWLPEPATARPHWITREKYAELMERVKMSERIRRFWLLAFGTGARSEAIEEATWDRFDRADRTIDYNVPGVIYKNKKRVVAPLNDQLFATFDALYSERTPGDPYIITRGRPRVNDFATTYHEANRCMHDLGVKKPGVARHIARHSFVTWLLRARVPIYEVALLVGDRVSMIEKVYSHVIPRDLRQAAAVAGGLVRDFGSGRY